MILNKELLPDNPLHVDFIPVQYPKLQRHTFLHQLMDQAAEQQKAITFDWSGLFEVDILNEEVDAYPLIEEFLLNKTTMAIPCVTFQWDEIFTEDMLEDGILWYDAIELDDPAQENLLMQFLSDYVQQQSESRLSA